MQAQLNPPGQGRKIHVKRLAVTNFKGFASYEVDLTPFNILVGPNNSGKSTILQAVEAPFHFLADISNSVENRLKSDLSRTAIDVSDLRVADLQDLWRDRKYRGAGNHPLPATFSMELSNGFRCKFDLNLFYRQPHIRLVECSPELSDLELEGLVAARPIMIPGFVGLLTREEFRTQATRNRIITDGRHTEVLRNVLLELKRQNSNGYDELNRAIDRFFGVQLSRVVFNAESDQFITADYAQTNTDLDLVSAGSGFLQVLQLLTFFYFVNPHIVLVDEPDAHLHSSLQRSLLELLRDLSKTQDIQFIITTHSKELINSADPESIVTISSLERKAQRLSSYASVLETLRGIGAVDNVDLALLVKNKKCLFVEDSVQAETLKRISRLMQKLMFEGDSQLVTVVRGGVTVNKYYDDLPVLRQFLGNNIKAISIIDGDFATEDMKTEIEQDSKNRGIDLHVLRKSEIENYLLQPALLSRVATSKSQGRGGPDISELEISSALEAAFQAVRDPMTDRISQQLSNWHKWKNEPISIPTANERARDYVKAKWPTLDGKMMVCQGKEVLAEVNKILQSKYSISLSLGSLLSELKPEEVDPELGNLVDQIANLWAR